MKKIMYNFKGKKFLPIILKVDCSEYNIHPWVLLFMTL